MSGAAEMSMHTVLFNFDPPYEELCCSNKFQ
jgi:hypothetical protein